jgi:multisubunit Na+/H+ antiporter MnhG subunit
MKIGYLISIVGSIAAIIGIFLFIGHLDRVFVPTEVYITIGILVIGGFTASFLGMKMGKGEEKKEANKASEKFETKKDDLLGKF